MMSDEWIDTLRRPAVPIGIVFVLATALLAVQFRTVPAITVTVGETTVRTGTRQPVSQVVSAVAAVTAGASGTYLLTTDSADAATSQESTESSPETAEDHPEAFLESRRQEWEATADRLANNEQTVYRTVLDADGVLAQNEIVEQTDLSKATVSRTLDSLEAKDLVERKRRGVGNVVVLF